MTVKFNGQKSQVHYNYSMTVETKQILVKLHWMKHHQPNKTNIKATLFNIMDNLQVNFYNSIRNFYEPPFGQIWLGWWFYQSFSFHDANAKKQKTYIEWFIESNVIRLTVVDNLSGNHWTLMHNIFKFLTSSSHMQWPLLS